MLYKIIQFDSDETHFHLEYIQENGFMNVTKLCNDYKKDFQEWKNTYYNHLYQSLQEFCHSHNIKSYHTIEYKNDVFMDPSIALHLAYWIDSKLGIHVCAFYFGIIFGSLHI
jgi:hypothetical protein